MITIHDRPTWYRTLGTTLSFLAYAACAVEPEPDADTQPETELAVPCLGMSAPVYHRVKPTTGASLYTRSASEAANAAAVYGFTEDHGTPFLAGAVSATGLSPVYRLYKASAGDFFWTIDESERASAKAVYGYVDQGIDFYASKTANACLTPVYRYVHPGWSKHRFATTTADRNALIAAGWTEEGIRFYAPAEPSQPPTTDPKFTFVVIPDTQREMWTSTDLRFNNRMQWIANNRTAQDIRFVTHTGDVVDWDTPDHIQYQRASTGFGFLDAVQLPYAIAIGNHDTAAVCPGGSACPGADTAAMLRVTTTFNSYFPTTRFRNLRGVFEPGKVDNAYHTFQAGGLDWIVINLELWPRTVAVNWAKSVLAAFPNHNAIFITHSHQTSSGSIEQSNGGYGANSPQYVFDNLYKQYANVRFVFSGHVGTTGFQQATGVHGNTFYQFLNCYHDMQTNPTRLVEIDTAARTIATRVYSPYTNEEKADGSKMTLTNVNFVCAQGGPC